MNKVVTIYVLTIILMIIISIIIGYKSSCVEARIYNTQNKAEYTCSDFFWAKDQINSKTQTIKIN